MVRTLAIETSCDDTSVAIVSHDAGNFSVEHLQSFSQIDLHQHYGGIVPEIAYRSHAEKIVPLLASLWWKAILPTLDCISVTASPGLPGALVVGITSAYSLQAVSGLPVIEVDHIMGHVFSVLLERSREELALPYVCLTVSGGHNDIYLVQDKDASHTEWETQALRHKKGHMSVWSSHIVWPFRVTKLAQTMDDAAGEVFDKVARMLDGPYPGGAWIGEQAKLGSADPARTFHVAAHHDPSGLFSFSGIKGQVHQRIQQWVSTHGELATDIKHAIAYGFQEAVVDALAKKLVYWADRCSAKTIWLVGGVSANQRLRVVLQQHLEKNNKTHIPCLLPTQFVYCTDNAAMIGACGLVMQMTK